MRLTDFVLTLLLILGNLQLACYAKNAATYLQEINTDLDELTEFNNKKVMITKNGFNWFQGDRLCRLANGALMRIENAGENTNLMNALKQKSHTRNVLVGFWLGARNDVNKTSFYWTSTGTDVSEGYTHWGPGQPNNLSRQEMECLDISVFPNGLYWNDFDCSKKQRVICEIPIQASSPTSIPCPTLPPRPPCPSCTTSAPCPTCTSSVPCPSCPTNAPCPACSTSGPCPTCPTSGRCPICPKSVNVTVQPPQYLKSNEPLDSTDKEEYETMEKVVALSTTMLVISLIILLTVIAGFAYMFLDRGHGKCYSQMSNSPDLTNSTLTFNANGYDDNL